MGRIGLVLALLIGWMSIADAGGVDIKPTPDQLALITDDKVEVPVAADLDAPERHHRCGMGEAILLLGSMMISAGLFIALVIIGFIRKRAPMTVMGEFVAPIHAENVARIVARSDATKFVVSLTTATGLWIFDHPFLAIMSGPFVLVWFIELVISRFAVGQFDHVQRLEKRENWIYINSTKLYAPRRAWAKASVLPAAAVLAGGVPKGAPFFCPRPGQIVTTCTRGRTPGSAPFTHPRKFDAACGANLHAAAGPP